MGILASDNVTTATLAAANDVCRLNMMAMDNVAFHVTAIGTMTLKFQYTTDGTSNFIDVNAVKLGTSPSVVATTTSTGIYVVHCPGAQYVQVIVSAWTSGTATITARATVAPLNTAALGLTSSMTSDTELPAAAALADNTANPTTPLVGACLLGLDEASQWDRLRTYLGAQGSAVATTPILAVASMLNDGSTNWVVQRTASAVLDTVAGGTIAPAAIWMMGANTPTFDRVRSTPLVTGTTGTGLLGAGPCLWDLVGTTNFVKQAGDGSGRAMVVGAAADGTALTGNPLRVGVSDGTNIQTWKQTTATSTAVAVTGIPTSGLVLVNGTNVTPIPTAGALGDGSASGANVPSASYSYNGGTWDRSRNNVEVTLLSSSSRTTTQTSADITTYNCGAIQVIYDNTVGTTYSDTLTIDGKDPASGKYYNLLTSAAIATVTTNVYTVDPAVPAVANVTAQKRLPRTIRIVVTAGNANAHTYSVGYILQPC